MRYKQKVNSYDGFIIYFYFKNYILFNKNFSLLS